jgi:hypothetical protein
VYRCEVLCELIIVYFDKQELARVRGPWRPVLAALSWPRIENFWSGGWNPSVAGEVKGGHVACAYGEDLLRGHPGASQRGCQRADVSEKRGGNDRRDDGRMRDPAPAPATDC